jgi:hypothetical protein
MGENGGHLSEKTIRISTAALCEIKAALKEYSAIIEAGEKATLLKPCT